MITKNVIKESVGHACHDTGGEVSFTQWVLWWALFKRTHHIPAGTGGKGTLTQWVHCEFVVSFEAIRPVITQQVCGEFF